ncbi:MAG: biotin synthase BioB [Muribaculaceae bacterium]|nr:biotin synthase BioB [Muribaculaceae bacterium]
MNRKELEGEALLEALTAGAMEGNAASEESLLRLAEWAETDPEKGDKPLGGRLALLCEAADAVRARWNGDDVDTCSIVNGRSGRCTENCKWCAQSASHRTGCQEYEMIGEDEFFRSVDVNDGFGVRRFSIVCSGRKVAMKDLRRYCDMYRRAVDRSHMSMCASMGLLNREELQALWDAGVRRYHCNLETSARYFPELCTSHTRQDKLRTIALAREVGMEVCSGGIIGMGETMADRVALAREAMEAGAVSMPVNLLSPIKGTPLEDTPLLGEREAVLSVALMKLAAPRLAIRFAGGRARLSREATERMLRGGVSGALVGDMLTTVGNGMADDFRMFRELRGGN